MKKHGFTLIEIIICIILITTISIVTTVVIIKNNEKKEQNTLKKYETIFDNALEVYLSNHEEITNNLNNYAKAAAVTLEVLKNDGLISSDLDIDYKNNYYLLSNAKLLDAGNTVKCDGDDPVSIEVFKKWDLSEYEDGKKVIYVCPKNNTSSFANTNITLQEKYSGSDPNNYIKIENVLWRIVEISNTGTYIVSTSKDDLIAYNDYNNIKTNSSEKYYNDYLEPNSVFISEYSGDNGHYGIDVAGIKSYIANIGTLNYTTVMNSTNVNGNYLIELLANMDTPLYCGMVYWGGTSFFTTVNIASSMLSNFSIIPVIKLKTCLKINNGTGTLDNPFEIDSKSC